MNPKSGTRISADLPDLPDEAKGATTADPGENAEEIAWDPMEEESASDEAPSGNGKTSSNGNQNSGEESKKEDPESESHWVEIELKDDKGDPIPGEAYKVTLPNGKTVSGRLDDQGKAEIKGLEKGGECEVTFPRIHGEEVSRS